MQYPHSIQHRVIVSRTTVNRFGPLGDGCMIQQLISHGYMILFHVLSYFQVRDTDMALLEEVRIAALKAGIALTFDELEVKGTIPSSGITRCIFFHSGIKHSSFRGYMLNQILGLCPMLCIVFLSGLITAAEEPCSSSEVLVCIIVTTMIMEKFTADIWPPSWSVCHIRMRNLHHVQSLNIAMRVLPQNTKSANRIQFRNSQQVSKNSLMGKKPKQSLG
jgi:hypothetical protein